MEKTIHTQILHGESWGNKITIDNSTDYKTMRVEKTMSGKVTEVSLDIKINGEEEVTLEIGKALLIGREIELLKEFLNQI